jgi:hypothetical protein
MIWKTSEKRMKQKFKIHWKSTPAATTMEDGISDLEDKMEIQGKTKELLVKQFKTC